MIASKFARVFEPPDDDGDDFDPLWDQVCDAYPDLAASASGGAGEAFDDLITILRNQAPDEYDGPPPPAGASQLPPGSALKLDLMEERVNAGQQCFHPDEAPNEAYARIIEVARNGRPQRRGILAESFAEQEEDGTEVEDELRFEAHLYLLERQRRAA